MVRLVPASQPNPLTRLEKPRLKPEPLMIALAAVAVGMCLGTWVLGPATSHNVTDIAYPERDRGMSYEAMLAQPDPNPYRYATPAFSTSGAPNYAALAKQHAQSEHAGRVAEGTDDGGFGEGPARDSGFRYRSYDRHRVY